MQSILKRRRAFKSHERSQPVSSTFTINRFPWWQGCVPTDIVLQVGSLEYPAHKLALAEHSNVFRAQLFGSCAEKMQQSNKLNITDTRPECVKRFLDCLYAEDPMKTLLAPHNGIDYLNFQVEMLIFLDCYDIEVFRVAVETEIVRLVELSYDSSKMFEETKTLLIQLLHKIPRNGGLNSLHVNLQKKLCQWFPRCLNENDIGIIDLDQFLHLYSKNSDKEKNFSMDVNEWRSFISVFDSTDEDKPVQIEDDDEEEEEEEEEEDITPKRKARRFVETFNQLGRHPQEK